ncbi:MAG: HD family phosphohydrolase [Planctomycetota bacterium]|nr:MAG: HD family phosphohydrolase [Planctomycetota bacterium]
MDSLNLRNRIESIDDLPTLPVVVTQILQATKSLSTNANDVGKLISDDQSLTVKVLKLVNSPFYGFPQKIKTITHAIVILGFAKVKNIVLAASVFGMTKGPKNSTVDICSLWEHALTTGIVCRQLAKLRNSKLDIEEAFVAGLLHDLGKVILICNLEDICEQVSAIVREKDCLFYEAEKELFDFGHDKIGVWLAEKWNLNPDMIEGIKCHHQPQKARGDKLMAYILHAGDIIARALDVGNGGDNKIPLMDPKVAEELDLTTENLDKLMISVLAELDKAKDFFDLIHDQN